MDLEYIPFYIPKSIRIATFSKNFTNGTDRGLRRLIDRIADEEGIIVLIGLPYIKLGDWSVAIEFYVEHYGPIRTETSAAKFDAIGVGQSSEYDLIDLCRSILRKAIPKDFHRFNLDEWSKL